MKWLTDMFKESPVWPRVLPFVIFVALTGLQDVFGEAGRYWVYFGKTLVGAWLVWLMRPFVEEMRWAWSWEALAAGVLVFVIWVGLDPWYPKLGGAGEPWNPFACFGEGAALGWFFFLVRLLGSSLVVPPLEETFYRSFVYRWVAKADFMAVPLKHFGWTPLLVTSGLFGFVHHQWLAGILCGLIYQGLVIRKNRLGDAMTAHAITNFLLGLWVIARPAWHFW
ncbi:MAG: CAAX prenyl protease-related protein [Verrucomicrobia bacterium]|nr:MAG: CAAX prenyl protease-related protein [Verrucomicrobiota bacterium]